MDDNQRIKKAAPGAPLFFASRELRFQVPLAGLIVICSVCPVGTNGVLPIVVTQHCNLEV